MALDVGYVMSHQQRLFNAVVVRPPTEDIVRCVSTHPLRCSINFREALRQHREYVSVLREEGVEVYEVPGLQGFPDAVFIQDTAIVRRPRGEALILRFSVPSRRGEEVSVAEFLRSLGYTTTFVGPPATIEGGDVLITDVGIVYVGITSRTNLEGLQYLRYFLTGLKVVPVPCSKVFHLLSAVTYLGGRTVALVPELVDHSVFDGFKLITVPTDEAYAANMLYLGGGKVLIPEGFRKTYEKLRREGFKPIEVDVSEFRKCDGGITCLSLPLYEF
ncbi:MAG: arginine deiminase family protein [Sulfolobales archaeon]